MNLFSNCFVFLELLMQLSCAVSYTVVLKQVKPVHPPVKVYRYELRHKFLPDANTQYVYHKPFLGQRIYPVVVKPGREVGHKTRVPVKKEKGKYHKGSPTTERSGLKESRQLGLSQHLVPPVSNQIEEFSEAKEEDARVEENDVRPLPPSPHAGGAFFGKSFSSFGQEKGRIYGNPGDWATPVPPQPDSENTTKAEFTPSQLYLQIRHKNTVIHVPQSEALKDAETLEELINAPRLKELSRTTHVQETYSEEGYEDAGYDHAGHVRQAQHGEVYDAKDEGRFKIQEAPIILDYDSDLEESKKVPLQNDNGKDLVEGNFSNKLEPRITHSRSEVSKSSVVEYAKVPKNYKGEHKYSSRVRSPAKTENGKFNLTDVQATFPSYFGEMPPTPESILANDSLLYVPPPKQSSKYRKGDSNSTQIYPVTQPPQNPATEVGDYTDFKPYISIIDSQPSPSAKSLKYSRIYSKKTKQLRLEPYKNEQIFPPPPPRVISPPPPAAIPPPQEVLQPPRETEEEAINERIVLPTIGYINSLTTAHFGKETPKPPQDESKPQLTDALNLTQALTYLRMNKHQNHQEVTKSPTEVDIRSFEPMKLKKSRQKPAKAKRDVYLMGKGNKSSSPEDVYEGDDESDLPHDEKNEEIAEDERKRIEEENREKEKYEADLRQEISKQEKQIIKETFRNIGVEGDVSEVFPEFPDSETESSLPKEEGKRDETTPTPVNIQKYPFYLSKKLPENSPLRYATDPRQFPKKSGHGMEFYESRDRLIQCPDIHPNLDDLPDSNSTEYSEEQAGENQRIVRVGDKIACLRMKYFDPEPFDNPIFKEREIDYVGKPGKGRKKIRNKKTIPKSAGKGDQRSQQTVLQKPIVVKINNRFNTSTQSLKPISTVQPEVIRQQTKPPFSPAQPRSNVSRIIPVIEIVDDLPPHTAFQSQSNPQPVIGWKTTYHTKPQPRLDPQATAVKTRIVKPHNCLPNISKLEALDGAKNLTIECNDVTLIQEIIKNVARLRVIPKEKEKKVARKTWKGNVPPDQSDWVPIVGYSLPKRINKAVKPLSRRTDEVKLKNETSHNASSNHYVIDELKEDENVRKGEVVEDKDHYMKLMDEVPEVTTEKVELNAGNSTRRRRETQNDQINLKTSDGGRRPEFSADLPDKSQTAEKSEPLSGVISKPFERKKPLTRLSGIDFLTRYHKNKGKAATQKVEDFWKITTAGPVTSKIVPKPQKVKEENEKTARTTSKSKENLQDRPTPSPTAAVTSTKKSDSSGTPELRKHQSNSSTERYNKPKIKQTNEYRKISPLNLIPEKITKRPEGKSSGPWKTSTENAERTTTKPHSFTKIITKVSRETSESSEKPRIVYKKPAQNFTAETSTARITSAKPEPLQYKTINRNSVPAEDDSQLLRRATENPEGPILYYVVNVKTGRGKWITDYDEQGKGIPRKLPKGKENPGTKRDKRRKKPKY